MSTFVDVLKVLGYLASAYPDKDGNTQKLAPTTIETYYDNLVDINARDLMEAAKYHIKHNSSFPTISALHGTVKMLKEAVEE